MRPIRNSAPGAESDLVVRLEQFSPEPITAVERLTVSALKAEGALPFHRLVERVASDLYQEELRNGAWILGIGLFGSRLFVADVANEIEAGNGVRWQIEKTPATTGFE